jgi:RimJ/RimL family protein N-acetyltransferase
LKRIADDRTIRMFTVVGGVKHEDVGVCGLTSIDHVNQSAEFSLYIGWEYQREGYGLDALETLVRHGFTALNLNRIWGEVFDENPAMEMFKQVGFKLEGKLRESYFRDGRFIHSHMISLLRNDWCSRSAS